MYKGIVVIGATPGNITLQWCQDGAVAFDITVKAGSYMTLRKV